jgi:putative membrane protein
MLRLALAALHLLALGLGMGAVLTRGNVLREVPTDGSLRRAFRADTLWGIAAALWLVTGLWRWLAGIEKPAGYYNSNHLFMLKMAFFVALLALEVRPMMTLIRWRRALSGGSSAVDLLGGGAGKRIAMISHTQALLLVLMICVAVAIARGYGVATN